MARPAGRRAGRAAADDWAISDDFHRFVVVVVVVVFVSAAAAARGSIVAAGEPLK